MAKIDLNSGVIETRRCTQEVLYTVIEQTLKLLHPFMPFITEEIWQYIPHIGKSIMTAPWPKFKEEWEFEDSEQMELIMDAVRGVRNIRAEMNVPQGKKTTIFMRVNDDLLKDILKSNLETIYRLAKVSEMEFIVETSEIPHKAVSCVIKGAEIFIPMEELVNIDTEVLRLKKEKENLENEIKRAARKLCNKGFLEKAPKDVVKKEQQKQRDYQEMLVKVKQRLKMMTDLSK